MLYLAHVPILAVAGIAGAEAGSRATYSPK